MFPYSAIQYVSHDYAKKRLYAADPRQVTRLRTPLGLLHTASAPARSLSRARETAVMVLSEAMVVSWEAVMVLSEAMVVSWEAVMVLSVRCDVCVSRSQAGSAWRREHVQA